MSSLVSNWLKCSPMVRSSNSGKADLFLGRCLEVGIREMMQLGSVATLVSFYFRRYLIILFIFSWLSGQILLLISLRTVLLTSLSDLFRSTVEDYIAKCLLSLINLYSSKLFKLEFL